LTWTAGVASSPAGKRLINTREMTSFHHRDKEGTEISLRKRRISVLSVVSVVKLSIPSN